jgi:hypothetical protein
MQQKTFFFRLTAGQAALMVGLIEIVSHFHQHW